MPIVKDHGAHLGVVPDPSLQPQAPSAPLAEFPYSPLQRAKSQRRVHEAVPDVATVSKGRSFIRRTGSVVSGAEGASPHAPQAGDSATAAQPPHDRSSAGQPLHRRASRRGGLALDGHGPALDLMGSHMGSGAPAGIGAQPHLDLLGSHVATGAKSFKHAQHPSPHAPHAADSGGGDGEGANPTTPRAGRRSVYHPRPLAKFSVVSLIGGDADALKAADDLITKQQPPEPEPQPKPAAPALTFNKRRPGRTRSVVWSEADKAAKEIPVPTGLVDGEPYEAPQPPPPSRSRSSRRSRRARGPQENPSKPSDEDQRPLTTLRSSHVAVGAPLLSRLPCPLAI